MGNANGLSYYNSVISEKTSLFFLLFMSAFFHHAVKLWVKKKDNLPAAICSHSVYKYSDVR